MAVFFFINFILQIIASFQRIHFYPFLSQKLYEMTLPVYAFTLFFIYSYFFYSAKKFRILIQKILETSKQPSLTRCLSNDDPNPGRCEDIHKKSTYPRFCIITIVVIMTYGIIENATHDIQNLGKADIKQANSTLQRYYIQLLYHWAPYLTRNSFLTLVYVFLIKCGTYAWIFGDIIVIILCRAVAERLRFLNEEIKESVESIPTVTTTGSHEQSLGHSENTGLKRIISWDDVRYQYMLLTDLVKDMGKFISPLILSCYGINIYLIIIHVQANTFKSRYFEFF